MLKSKYKRQRLVHCVHILIGDCSHISAMARYRNSSKYWRMREGDQRKREEEKGEERGERWKGKTEQERERSRKGQKEKWKSREMWGDKGTIEMSNFSSSESFQFMSTCAVRAWERNLNLFGPNFYVSLKFLCLKVSIFQVTEPLNERQLLQLVLKHRN